MGGGGGGNDDSRALTCILLGIYIGRTCSRNHSQSSGRRGRHQSSYPSRCHSSYGRDASHVVVSAVAEPSGGVLLRV